MADGCGGGQRAFRRPADVGGQQREHGAHALGRREERVAHRAVERLRLGGVRGRHPVEFALNRRDVTGDEGRQLHSHTS